MLQIIITTAFILVVVALLFLAVLKRLRSLFNERAFGLFIDFLKKKEYYRAFVANLKSIPIDLSVTTVKEFRVKCKNKGIPCEDFLDYSFCYQNSSQGILFWTKVDREWREFIEKKGWYLDKKK